MFLATHDTPHVVWDTLNAVFRRSDGPGFSGEKLMTLERELAALNRRLSDLNRRQEVI